MHCVSTSPGFGHVNFHPGRQRQLLPHFFKMLSTAQTILRATIWGWIIFTCFSLYWENSHHGSSSSWSHGQPHACAAWPSDSVSSNPCFRLHWSAKVISQPCSEPGGFDSVVFSALPPKVQNVQFLSFSDKAQVVRSLNPGQLIKNVHFQKSLILKWLHTSKIKDNKQNGSIKKIHQETSRMANGTVCRTC